MGKFYGAVLSATLVVISNIIVSWLKLTNGDALPIWATMLAIWPPVIDGSLYDNASAAKRVLYVKTISSSGFENYGVWVNPRT